MVAHVLLVKASMNLHLSLSSLLALLSSSLLAVGCAGSPSHADGGDAGTEVSDPGRSPRLLSLSANPLPLTPSMPTVISALVSDPQGLATLAGGKLNDENGVTLGVFSTPGGQGTFTYALAWGALQQNSPINFSLDGGVRRVTAIFYDADGNHIAEPFPVALACERAGQVSNNGTCATPAPACGVDSDCQSWAQTLKVTPFTAYCRSSLCMVAVRAEPPTPCNAYCADKGLRCVIEVTSGIGCSPDAGVAGCVVAPQAGCRDTVPDCSSVVSEVSCLDGGTAPVASHSCYCRT
jgi:hypothetical protein